jgi:hypothetical protein
MDIALINAFWDIAKNGGSTGLLFLFGVLIWNKLDKKDQKIYELIETMSKLQSMNQMLLQILSNDK